MDGADLLPCGISPLVNGSKTELYLLLLKHRGGKKGRESSGSLRGSSGGVAGDDAGGDATADFGEGVGDIRLSRKIKHKWHKRLVNAATTKSQGFFREALRKLTTANVNGGYCCDR